MTTNFQALFEATPAPCLALTRALHIEAVTDAYLRATNKPRADDQQHARERWRHSLGTGEEYEIQYRLRAKHGAYRWVLGRALPLYDDVGKLVRWRRGSMSA